MHHQKEEWKVEGSLILAGLSIVTISLSFTTFALVVLDRVFTLLRQLAAAFFERTQVHAEAR
jgi:hypothetical protein